MLGTFMMASPTAGARSLQALPAATARLLSSTQVITSVFSVVKELVENSLDAHATSVDVKLESFGFDRIVVSDNGSGISRVDAEYMAQRHYTSKLSHQADLDSLETYGFRGEALGSLCAVADVTVTTKTAADDFSMMYTLDRQGKVTCSKPAHLGQGTTITVTNLFKNVPVRRQYYSAPKRRKEELKRVEDVMMALGVIKPDVRFSLIHNKCTVWQKNKSVDHRTALLNVLGTGTMSLLQGVEHSSLEPQVEVQGFLPKPGADPQAVTRATTDRSFVYFNERPVQMKGVEKLVRQYYHGSTSDGASSRHPIIFLSIRVPPAEIDPNVEPNKTKVLLHNNEGHTTMYDLVGNKPVKKPQSAYSFFIKEVRPDVCQEHFEADFAEIARLIDQRWNQLTNEERRRYEAMATRDQQRYQAHLKTLQESESNSDSPAPRKNKLSTKKRKLDPVSHQTLIDKMFQSQKSRKENNENNQHVLKVVDVSFSMTWLKENVGKEVSNKCDETLRLIGRLAPHGVWVGVQGSEVVAVHQYRIQEALLYNRLMETHVLPQQPLRAPVVLNASTTGWSLAWQTLLNLDSESAHPTPSRRICDPRLVNNGFDVQLTSDEEGNVRAEVVAMTTCMPFYGLDDLKEILGIISRANSTTVSTSRPVKVIHYLKGEAVRMSRGLSRTMSHDDVRDILMRKEKELPKCRTCLHSKPFIQTIYTLEELSSQCSQEHSQAQ
ncbi:PMS1 [Branchiostoma lanceolatum]|uniref:PMS1 protein n=1 Tax=Branchiostoma lanceolatum TaxID=7740 RepID=A0A8J9YMP0_BRALA|nr:PMS1 [Branchiostoma lanceolatum]